MAGYSEAHMPEMQRRMLDAVSNIPGVAAVGYISNLPLSLGGGDSYVYTDSTTDYRPTNYRVDAMDYNISARLPGSSRNEIAGGQEYSRHDDEKAPKVALVNRAFAVKVFGSVQNAIGGHFKFWGGIRAEVVGVVEDGKYRTLTEDQMPAMFFSFQQQKTPRALLLVRSSRDPRRLPGRWSARCTD